MEVLALVTARGNSKSIPGKNILGVAGKPLIAWSIEAALESAHVGRVVISTDSPVIAAVGRSYGAEAPFLRPGELALDHTPHIDAILHAVNWLKENQDYSPDYVLLLQPTCPLRTSEDIDASIGIAASKHVDAVVSVAPASSHPFLAKRIDAMGYLRSFVKSDIAYLRRQDLPAVYSLNGAIYLTRCEVLLRDQVIVPVNSLPYIMPPERSLDLDEPWQLEIAEFLLQKKLARKAA